ncbi:dipeptidyl carboxypeptidase II [Escherichia coli]|uniref:Dipeptidyl carboxypeptidase II n=1 Tax=Escherichia coli TaxID=562 RepID=A0A484X440_ECOLX|nr:dipeptidyl carboxypeptidase II [Escherichia coli]
MGNFVEQSTLNETHPVIYNVCNYQKPLPVSLRCYSGMM